MIPTGVFAVFLCTRSDFPRGRELDDWFGYRFFEVVPVRYPFNTRSIPVQYLTIGFPAPLPSYASEVGAILSHTQAPAPPTHTHPTHTGTRTRTNVNFDPLVTWDVCLGNALRSIPPVIPPFNTSRSIPPFNTLLNRRLPHIHRGPGVLTHSRIMI